MKSKWRIFLADDHAILRDGIKTLINAQNDMCVVGEAANGQEALELCHQLRPDVIVTDISMPDTSGVELTRKLTELCPSSKTMILTMHESAAFLRQLLEAGAAGYAVKRSDGEDLLHGIRSIAKGGTYIDPKVAEKLTAGIRSSSSTNKKLNSDLSEREIEVLKMTAEGYSSREIAETLNIGKKSVDTYKSRAMRKLGLDSRSDIVRYVLGQGWIS